MNGLMRRIFLLALLMSCASACAKKDESGSPLSAEAGAAAEAGATAPAVADASDLIALVDLVVAEANALPREEFDPAALARKLGKDPRAHFEWVRDKTWWAPYRGLLRGAQGVMLDRVGSSLDRAVLLAELLHHAGHSVRLAHARLPEGRADEFLNKIAAMPGKRRNEIVRRSRPVERQRAIESLMPGHEQVNQERAEKSRQIATEATALVRTQAEQLYAAVEDLAGQPGSKSRRKSLAAMQDHWWVESKADGKWIAMDVLLPDAVIGNTPASPAAKIDWKVVNGAPPIPDDEWHSVRVRVVVERYETGTLTESTVLDTTLKPAIVIDRPITLRHMPLQWPENIPDDQADPNALGNAAVNVKEWMPFLAIGEELVSQSAFTETGDVKHNPLSAGSDVAEAAGGSLFGGFDDALSGGSGATSHVTAEWIDFEIRSPGEDDRRIRRPVFDLLGPASRAAGIANFDPTTNEHLLARSEALMSSTDMLLQTCEFTGAFVAHLLSAGIVARQDDLRDLAKQGATAQARTKALEILAGIGTWGPLPDLVLWRAAISLNPGDSFVDRPNILNYRITPPLVNADVARPRHLIDFVANSTGTRPNTNENEFKIRLNQGVSDTVAEVLALGGDTRKTENTAAVFSNAAERAVAVRVIRQVGSGEAENGQLGLPPDTTARIVSTVASGYIVVAPSQAVQLAEQPRLGWWRVNPETGETIGVMDTGFHAGFTEEELTRLNTIRRTLTRWRIDQDHARMAAIRSRLARGRPVSPSAQAEYEFYELVDQVIYKLVGFGA